MKEDIDFDRRDVMKGIGVAALGGLALSGTASASKPSDLKIQWAPFVDTSNIDNKPSYKLAFGFKIKDENAPFVPYVGYGIFKLFHWSGDETITVGPIVLDDPASKQVVERLSLRDKREGWYRATATLMVFNPETLDLEYAETALENFKFEK
jgi:hypothetical protein